MWTLVGGGMKRLEDSGRPMADVLPRKAHWIQDRVVEFQPQDNYLTTSSGLQVLFLSLLFNHHIP